MSIVNILREIRKGIRNQEQEQTVMKILETLRIYNIIFELKDAVVAWKADWRYLKNEDVSCKMRSRN